MIYNELKPRGTADFPVEYFYIAGEHPRYQMSAHWHGEVELIRVLSGELSVSLDGRDYLAKSGDVLFVNPETVHRAIPKDAVYECIVFHADFLYNHTKSCEFFIESILSRHCTVQEFFPKDDSLCNLFGEVFASAANPSSGYKFRTIGALYSLFGEIVDRHLYTLASGSSPIPGDKSILNLKKLLAFIRTNYSGAITLSDMARVVDMSPKYLGSFFKNMTGKTPFEYLAEYRIEKAAQKLLNSPSSVTEIAFACGFSDISYFIKTFKNHKGISPRRFRNSHQ